MLRVKFGFSVISNIRNPVVRTINNRVITYDSYLDRYEDPYVIAYTHKRRPTKQQIPPKITILENKLSSIQRDLKNQMPNQYLDILSIDMMGQLYENMEIITPYIFSKFYEKGFKELIVSYSTKLLLNGKMPPIEEVKQYNLFIKKVIQLYRIFYYGQNLSTLEQFIETQYLHLKSTKFQNYMKSSQKSIKKKNQLLKCIWNQENQRSLQGYDNWQSRPFDDYADFRPFFKEIFTAKKQELINQNTVKEKENLDESITRDNVQFISLQLFNRILDWCGCLQFNRILKLPTDYLIELSIIGLHTWMLTEMISRNSKNPSFVTSLTNKFRDLVYRKLMQISVETGTSFHQDVFNKLIAHWKIYQMHFQGTFHNRYQNLDSLVYATALLSKVDRYSDTVYLISQYFYQNYKHLSQISEKEILKGNVQFDVYLVQPDFKHKFLSSAKWYPFKTDVKQILTPISKPKLELENKSLSSKIFRLMNIMARGLKSYDFYSEVQKQEKENKQQKQTGWDLEGNLDDEFNSIRRLREKAKK